MVVNVITNIIMGLYTYMFGMTGALGRQALGAPPFGYIYTIASDL
jgi:hypothetical protein